MTETTSPGPARFGSEVENSVPAPARARNFGLDAVRALAIVLVLAAHYYQRWFPAGVLGVELFFVLSGYLIGGILHRQLAPQVLVERASLWLFWRRRWYRTLPLYYLFLVISFALAWNSSRLLGATFRTLLKYCLFLQNLAWPIDGFSAVTWSLAIEEWFYFLFPLSLLVLNRCGIRVSKAFGIAIVFFMLVPLVLRCLFPHPDWNHTTRMEVVCRLDALMFGVGLAVLKPRGDWLWRRSGTCALAGAALLLAGLPLLLHGGSAPGRGLGPAFLFTLIPLGASLLLPAAEMLPSPPAALALPIRRLSEWSYALYLGHIPVMFLCFSVVHDAGLGVAGKICSRAGALAATLAVARTLHRHFELPLTRLRPGG